MNDTTWLFLLLVAVYIYECFGWTSKHTVLFKAWWTNWRSHGTYNRRRIQTFYWNLPGRWFGNDTSGLHVRHLLPPLGNVFHCPVWPASLSPVAALAWVPFAMDANQRPDQSAAYFAWHAGNGTVRVAHAMGKSVFLDDHPLVVCATEAHARQVLQQIDRIAQAPNITSREQIIDDQWRAAFDIDAIRVSLQRYDETVFPLRVVANVLFVLIFLIAPIVVFLFGLGGTWKPLLAGLVTLMLLAARYFYRAHLRLQPDLNHERWKYTCVMLLSPPGAIRAVDAIARDQLIGFHPLAVAQVVLDDGRFVEFARRYLLDFRYALPSQLSADAALRDTLQWHMRREAHHIRQFLSTLELPVDDLTHADPPADEGCKSFCPRCQCQFVILAGRCSLCDLPLVAFPSPIPE